MKTFRARDGVTLAYSERGEGRPLVLLHGYLGDAEHSWAGFALPGHRLLMPDMRGHGRGEKPHDPAAYPPDVMVDDALAFVEHLGLTDYDLGGYSVGGRTVVRMLVRGARPARAIVAGVGLEVLDNPGKGAFYRHLLTNLGTFAPGTPEARAEVWLREADADPIALLHVLDALVDTSREELATIPTPTLVVIGADDTHGGAGELAALLPHGRHQTVPGDHGSALASMPAAFAAFLEPEHL